VEQLMIDTSLISIETTRYSEFFRRLFNEYGNDTRASIDSRTVEGRDFAQFVDEWCVNDRIKQTKNFSLHRGKTELFGFHDHPRELWAATTELPFVERLAAEQIVRFKVVKSRG
jgi:hypothetical protein